VSKVQHRFVALSLNSTTLTHTLSQTHIKNMASYAIATIMTAFNGGLGYAIARFDVESRLAELAPPQVAAVDVDLFLAIIGIVSFWSMTTLSSSVSSARKTFGVPVRFCR
jgi:hypothetical protein